MQPVPWAMGPPPPPAAMPSRPPRRSLVRELGRHWTALLGILLVTLTAAVAAYVISDQGTRLYTSEARLAVTSGLGLDQTSSDVLEAVRLGQTYAVLATTRPVLTEVIGRADLAIDEASLASRLLVTANLSTPFISVSMTDEDPEQAATVANALSQVLVERSASPATGRQILEVVDPAVAPQAPSSPRVLFATVLAASAALIVALAIVVGLAYLRQDPAERQGAAGW